ncbi:MAG: hypothetical protein LBI88_00510 [Deltaproteobacteria bacterium]|jgi:hypothetical protein|nr:hypothetical protein [Deltaproteobacteria bacterium]
MSVFAGIPIVGGLIGRVFDRLLPDKAKINEAQSRINESEVQGGPASVLRLWRGFVGWTLGLCLAWELACRPVIATYWPEALLPPSMLKEVLTLLLGMLGLA